MLWKQTKLALVMVLMVIWIQPTMAHAAAGLLKETDEAGNPISCSNAAMEAALPTPSEVWMIETVDIAQQPHMDLVYDPSGNPSIAYNDYANGSLKLARWNGISWDIEIVGGGIKGVGLAYDHFGNPNMSFLGADDHVRFARWNGSSWDIEQVDKRRTKWSCTSLAYDPADGFPSITYRVNVKNYIEMAFAHWNGTAWDIKNLHPSLPYDYSSLVYAPDDNPAIGYGDQFAHWNGTSWDIVSLADGNAVRTKLAFDPSGNPALVYQLVSDNIIRFARRIAGTWHIETVDNGSNCSFTYDSAGNAFISYYDRFGEQKGLKVARYDALTGQKEIEIVAAASGVFSVYNTSIALDPSGNPTIAYGTLQPTDVWELRFARKVDLPPDTTPPAAVTDLTVDYAVTAYDSVTLTWTATGDDGYDGTATLYDIRYSTIPITDENFDNALSAQGEPVPLPSGSPETFTVTGLAEDTTYYFALKVADEAGNVSDLSNVVFETTPLVIWEIQTVDTDGVFGITDLAYDPFDNNPSIAYKVYASGPLRFAHWNGASWDIEEIAIETFDMGSIISLAYDYYGNPSVSYITNDERLKFARRQGASWVIEELDRRVPRSGAASLTYDPFDGNPSISYRVRAKGNIDMMFAHWNGSSWDFEVVEAGGGHRYSSLAYDPYGNPVIAYGGKIAYWNGASWYIEMVQDGDVFDTSLSYDPVTGCPTLAYRLYGSTQPAVLHFARYDGTTWNIEIVDSGRLCSHACDSYGNVFISYYDLSGETNFLKVARQDAITGQWDIEVVVASIANFERIPLALDPAEKPSISYGATLANGDHELQFARKIQQP